MNEEEAIKQLEPLAEYFDKHIPAMGGDAIRLSISALCSQQTKLDRSRWEGCGYCNDQTDANAFDFSFCPYCGNPLTEEAWAELERRIGCSKNK